MDDDNVDDDDDDDDDDGNVARLTGAATPLYARKTHLIVYKHIYINYLFIE